MNERFKELAEQAEKYADANFKGEHFWTQAYESKFAELIVKECITKVELRREFAIEDDHNVDEAFSLLIYDIESHFGVEE